MRISDWSSDVCSSDLSITHFSSARSASSVFGGNSSNDRVRPASSRSGIRAMGCKRYFVVVPTAQTTLGGSDLAGHDAPGARAGFALHARPRSEEHTSELQSLMRISYAVFCLKKKKKHTQTIEHTLTTINNRSNQK